MYMLFTWDVMYPTESDTMVIYVYVTWWI